MPRLAASVEVTGAAATAAADAAAHGALHRRRPAGVGPRPGQERRPASAVAGGRAGSGPSRGRRGTSPRPRGVTIDVDDAGRRRRPGSSAGDLVREAGDQLVAACGPGTRRRPTARSARSWWPAGAPDESRAVEHELHRRADAGEERLVDHPAVVDQVDVDDRGSARARLDVGLLGEARRRQQSADRVVRHGDHHGVGVERRRRPSRSAAPSGRRRDGRDPGTEPDVDAGVVERRRGRVAVELAGAAPSTTRCRPPSLRSSRPVRNTLAASANDASLDGRLTVGADDEVPQRRRWPGRATAVSASQSPKVIVVEAGSARSRRRRRQGGPHGRHPLAPA